MTTSRDVAKSKADRDKDKDKPYWFKGHTYKGSGQARSRKVPMTPEERQRAYERYDAQRRNWNDEQDAKDIVTWIFGGAGNARPLDPDDPQLEHIYDKWEYAPWRFDQDPGGRGAVTSGPGILGALLAELMGIDPMRPRP